MAACASSCSPEEETSSQGWAAATGSEATSTPGASSGADSPADPPAPVNAVSADENTSATAGPAFGAGGAETVSGAGGGVSGPVAGVPPSHGDISLATPRPSEPSCVEGTPNCACASDGSCAAGLVCDPATKRCAAEAQGADGAGGSATGVGADAGLGDPEEVEGAESSQWVGYVATVENTGSDCLVASLAEPAALPLDPKLPDPFTKIDGTRISERGQWPCRRQELHKQAEKYVYGEKPPKPDQVNGSVTRDQITVEIQHAGKSIEFSADVVLPSTGDGPFPAIINLGRRGGFGGMTLGEDFVLEQGVAVIYYNHYDLGAEGTPEQSRGLPNPGLFYDIYGGDHSAGLLMSWAWGASRILDVLQESGAEIIDPTAVGVTGCSRNGKGAFAVGVFDERIALTIPQETSTAGVPAYRIVDVLNTERTDHNFYGLNWLSNDFEPFVLNAGQLPLDSHEMIAMIAPRGLLVLDNPHLAQFSAPAGHTAVMAGLPVFEQLGVEAHLGYVSNIANDQHCAPGKPEYVEPLRQYISTFLKREGAAPGLIEPHAAGMGNLAEWVEWQAPTLAEARAAPGTSE